MTPTIGGTSEQPEDAGPAIAYLVLAHADADHFGRMLRRLADPRAVFVVHVDSKVDAGPFRRAAEGIGGVIFVERRLKVMWAAFSQVQSTLRTIEAALSVTGPACTHFVVLSGSDYPIAGNDEIFRRFADNPRRQFIRRFDILNCGDPHQIWRLRGRHFRQLADRFTLRRRPLFVIERALRLFPKEFPADLTFASGSNWCALTRDCAAYCVSFTRDNPKFKALFRYMFGPDEIFFHTLVQNSPFVSEAEPIEPYTDVTGVGGPWLYGNLHVLNPILPIRTGDEATKILRNRGDHLFARKFGTLPSAEALATIDAALDAWCPESRRAVRT